jgi:hypothetical protein
MTVSCLSNSVQIARSFGCNPQRYFPSPSKRRDEYERVSGFVWSFEGIGKRMFFSHATINTPSGSS